MLSSMEIQIPKELADRLMPVSDRIPDILELGLRRFNAADRNMFEDADDVLEFLAALPEPEEILKLRPSPVLQEKIDRLLEKNRNEGFSREEEIEWEQYQHLEHLVRMAKAKALMKLKKSGR